MKKLIIWGASGHALVVADIIRLSGEYEIVGFLDDISPDRQYTNFCGSTIIGGQEQLDILIKTGVNNIILAMGNCEARLRLSDLINSKGFSLVTAVHPAAIVAADATIGTGTVVVAGAVINPGVTIGENVIVNTSASIDHECIIGDGVHVSPGVHLAGCVVVGRAAWIGIGATIMDRVKIGDGAIIGAGAVVVKDIPAGVVAYGIPAKPVK